MKDSRRSLPSIHWLITRPELVQHTEQHGRERVVSITRELLDEIRAIPDLTVPLTSDFIVNRLLDRLELEEHNLQRVINATGVLLHTGLGRAPLGPRVLASLKEASTGYCNLEFDLITGERSNRGEAVSELLHELTGAEAAAVVNNNAGATLLALRVLAADRSVIVSRGQLVEIGGSYRLPEVFEASGARLVEVGTTNKTRLGDYERAITSETAALLRVHTSNYEVVGFTESVPIEDLARLAASRGIVCIDDIGSGALSPQLPPGLRGEPSISASLAAGANLVLASGDKLLGGPQCGLILGDRRLVARIIRDPLMRALRVDKLTLTALEAVLRLARSPSLACSEIPLWRFLATDRVQLASRARKILEQVRPPDYLQFRIVNTDAQIGGGSVPSQLLPSVAIRIDILENGLIANESELARFLRNGTVAVVPRVQGGAVWLDLKAVFEYEDSDLVRCLSGLMPSDEDHHSPPRKDVTE